VSSRLDGRAGFTLLEMLVVITVIAILAALVSPSILGNVSDAKLAAARSQLGNLELALDTYRLDNDAYPSTAQGLDALTRRPVGEPEARNWRGPYLKRAVPLDPWGHPYLYQSPADSIGRDYALTSLGRDAKPGGEGEDTDLTSWDAIAQ
jgi:general secretion pathway protein G